jgi:hypothetical protein
MKIKHKFYIPDKEFSGKGDFKEITITVKEPNKNGDVLFEADMPQHVFDKLKNTAKEYMTKEEGGSFRRKVSYPTYKWTIDTLQGYCYDAQKIEDMEKLDREKKLFIKFDFSNKLSRDNWCGAGTGNILYTRFQFFVGYKTSTIRNRLTENGEGQECVKYLTEFVDLVPNRHNHKDGTLQPLNMDWEHKKVEQTYKIVDWTQEREDFLQEIENKFNDLGTKLNEFLGDLDSKKLDTLIENKLKLLD